MSLFKTYLVNTYIDFHPFFNLIIATAKWKYNSEPLTVWNKEGKTQDRERKSLRELKLSFALISFLGVAFLHFRECRPLNFSYSCLTSMTFLVLLWLPYMAGMQGLHPKSK